MLCRKQTAVTFRILLILVAVSLLPVSAGCFSHVPPDTGNTAATGAEITDATSATDAESDQNNEDAFSPPKETPRPEKPAETKPVIPRTFDSEAPAQEDEESEPPGGPTGEPPSKLPGKPPQSRQTPANSPTPDRVPTSDAPVTLPEEPVALQPSPEIVSVQTVSVSSSRNMYKIGEQCLFSVQVYPEDAVDKTYTVTISGAATEPVGSDGITLIESGTVLITAEASNGVKGELSIKVVDLAAFAREVFRLTNIERQNAGLAQFSQVSALTATAATRAREACVSFSHTRPNGQECFSAYAENGVVYSRAAENIAFGQNTPAEVVAGWMGSPGHRANILNPDLCCLGTGVAMNSEGILYWTQSFTD
ncbi:MAG: CAP domain-containing protein [Oscillospiraceae bacterium]|jgi:uncharacterized protein YkwD|nr:CAP domain-containing protein [Oscillospiraceae bacterium]